MPKITVINDSRHYSWISITIWSATINKHDAISAGDMLHYDTGDNVTWFAWKYGKTVISGEEWARYRVRIRRNSFVAFSRHPPGHVPGNDPALSVET